MEEDPSGANPVLNAEELLLNPQEAQSQASVYIVCYESRPLQVIPPLGQGPHLLAFQDEVAARRFLHDRQQYFPEEPLSLAWPVSVHILFELLQAPSDDPRYEGPPSGLVLDFNYQTGTTTAMLPPSSTESMSSEEFEAFFQSKLSKGDVEELAASSEPLIAEEKPDSFPIKDQEAEVPVPHSKEQDPEKPTAGSGARSASELLRPAAQLVADHSPNLEMNSAVSEPAEKGTGSRVSRILRNRYVLLVLLLGVGTLCLISFLIIGVLGKELQHFPMAFLSSPTARPTDPPREAVPTLAPTRIPTPVPDHVLLMEESFNHPYSGWTMVEDTGFGSVMIADGFYRFYSTSDQEPLMGMLPRDYGDVLLEVRVLQQSGSERAMFGVTCRMSERGGYQFVVTRDGWFSIIRWDAAGWIPLVDWTQTEQLQLDNLAHTLGVSCEGADLALSINGEEVASVVDTVLDNGSVGFTALAAEGEPADFLVDDVRLSLPRTEMEAYKACFVSDIVGLDDRRWNEQLWKGLQRAEQQWGIQTQVWESTSSSDYAPYLEEALAAGCDLVATSGFFMYDATLAAARANPDVLFTFPDPAYDDLPDNLLQQDFFTDEAAFLAGYLAAGMTETGVVATFGGLQIPVVTLNMDGFALGVAHYNDIHSKRVTLLGWDPLKQHGAFTGNFERTADGRAMAERFMDQGADIIFPVAGPVGLGAAAVAAERGGLIIGVDSDWERTAPEYGDVVLGSVIERTDILLLEAIRIGMALGSEEWILYGTLGNGGVELLLNTDEAFTIPASLQRELEELKLAIMVGEVRTYVE